MMSDDTSRMPPPLSPSVEALLAHERVPPSQPEMIRARTLARARESLREIPAATLSARAAPTRIRRLLFAAAAGITLMVGAAAAFQMMGRPTPNPPTNPGTPRAARQPPVAPPSTAPEPAPTRAPEAAPARTAAAAEAAFARLSVPSRRKVLTGKPDGEVDELQLLDRARQSDARGDYASVLAIAAEHERIYPAGRLSEEREVLRVKALVGLGRGREARQAAAKFRRRFSHSVLLQKIDDMLASLP